MLLTESIDRLQEDATDCPVSVAETAAEWRSCLRLALVIPTLREAANLPAILTRVRAALDSTGAEYEILVVDDDSQDGTEELVWAIHEEDPRVRLLVRKGERGLAGAVVYGWSHTQAELLGVMDADMQHPPELLPELHEAIRQGHDIAIGSRYRKGGRLDQWNAARRLISRTAILATVPLIARPIRSSDPMAGYFLVRRECVEGIDFQPQGFKLLLEILVRGRIRTLTEVPISFGLREHGHSKASMRVAWEYALLLARLYGDRFFTRRGMTGWNRLESFIPVPRSADVDPGGCDRSGQ